MALVSRLSTSIAVFRIFGVSPERTAVGAGGKWITRLNGIAKFRKFCHCEDMLSERRTYKIDPITVNEIKIVQVVIDTHYEAKHHSYMSDALILRLVKELDGRHELPEAKTGRYSYFATLVESGEKEYRLIWLLEDHAIYIGVVNAYRHRRRS